MLKDSMLIIERRIMCLLCIYSGAIAGTVAYHTTPIAKFYMARKVKVAFGGLPAFPVQ